MNKQLQERMTQVAKQELKYGAKRVFSEELQNIAAGIITELIMTKETDININQEKQTVKVGQTSLVVNRDNFCHLPSEPKELELLLDYILKVLENIRKNPIHDYFKVTADHKKTKINLI